MSKDAIWIYAGLNVNQLSFAIGPVVWLQAFCMLQVEGCVDRVGVFAVADTWVENAIDFNRSGVDM